VKARIDKLLSRKKGVMLDISMGGTPQPRSLTIGPSGDVRTPLSRLPFPLPDECAHGAVVTHALEFLPPELFFDWWNELWRVVQPHAKVYVSGPYGGVDDSHGWVSDPTHRTRIVEQSFAWLDVRMPFYKLHPNLGRPTPKPWTALATARVPGTHGTISYNVTLQRLPLDWDKPKAALKAAPKATPTKKKGGRK